MRFTFIIPPVDSFVSGGNWYNRYFTEALSRIAEVQLIRLEDWNPASHSDSVVVMDSIYLGKLNHSPIQASRNDVLLLHYLDIFFDKKHDQNEVAQTLEQLTRFDHFVVTSAFVQDWLLDHGVKKESIFLFEPVVLTPRYKSNASFSHPFKVLMLGNLLPVKGYLECLSELEAQQPAAIEVTIVADASIDRNYAKQVYASMASSEYLRSTVVFRDPVVHDQVFDLFDESDLLLSASQFETFGIAIHEALAFQLPVAALSTGNIAHIKHPNLFKYEAMPALISSLQVHHRTRLIPAPAAHEIKKPASSWDAYAALFRTHLAGLIK